MAIGIRHSITFKRQILIISDNDENQVQLAKILSEEYEVQSARSAEEALEKCQSFSGFSLLILDLDLPDMDSFAFIRRFRELERVGKIPIIAIMASVGSEAKTLRAGAADFVRKPFQAEVILARCERIIELSVDQSLIRLAQDDPLTGLYNRDFFFEYVRQIESNLESPDQDAMVLNIEHFHLLNELYGREFGNQVLIHLADSIRKLKDRMDSIICRADADTFYIYCRHQDAYEPFVAGISDELTSLSASLRVRLRAGVYQNVDPTVVPEVWFDRAKKACDRIREDYTRHVCYYDSKIYERTIFEEKLIHDIHDAIRENRVLVYYQPKFDISGETRVLCSAEALVRWTHPEFGLIPPADFIPLFEKNGLILKLDRYVWDQAARQVRAWKDQYGIDLPVSVNVSHIDLYDDRLEEEMEEIIAKYGLSPRLMHLEITESSYSEDTERLLTVVGNLRKKGFLVEMDDFGSGYSSLNMLPVLPFDVLKLDREFIRNMTASEKGLRVVQLVLDLARSLQVRCIAEGVETQYEYQMLRQLHCDIIQGFYFSRPLTPPAFDRFLEKELGHGKG